jgi:maltose/maltodextrin transport system substrate-binding protein
MEAGFNQGKIAMMINGPWSWDNARKSKINYGVATIPTVAGKTATPFVGVLGDFKSQPEQGPGDGIPGKPDAADQWPENHQRRRPAGHASEQGAVRGTEGQPEHPGDDGKRASGPPDAEQPEMGRFWSSMQSALENITQGRQTTKDGLDAAAKRLRRRIKRHIVGLVEPCVP